MLSVREIQQSDIALITHYWLGAEPAFLTAMGVDISKMPLEEEWREMLSEQIRQPYDKKKSYCIIWQVDGRPAGHCNVNKIKFREEAFMHLHFWQTELHQKGMGTELVKMSLPYFFNNLQLKKLYSEPYALNPAPNRTLEKSGFSFVRQYITTPGWINFEQSVNRWEFSYEYLKQKK